MNLSNAILIVLANFIIVALLILNKTRKRLKEIDAFRRIKESGDNYDDGVIGTFGD